MNTTINRQQLHDLINIVDSREFDIIYRLLMKFIPEATPFPDEIEAIQRGRKQIENGEVTNFDDIDWD
jgi:hypothetical protein